MTDAEKREAARQFYNKWKGKGREDEDDRSYWLDILQRVLGVSDATDRIDFQKKVIVEGNTKRIDAYIPETRTIIEQKTLNIPLDKKAHQSGGIFLTPYEQAKRYNDNLPTSEKARWIVTSNFEEIWIYDMDTRIPEDNITILNIKDLQNKYSMLSFLLNKKVKTITEEMELSLKAGELVGKIYDCFLKQYINPDSRETQNNLNILCVRLVFCLYAEDAGLFGEKDAFSKYITQYEPKDIRRALVDLFKVLDTPYEKRVSLYLDEELEAFPYVNGGLFSKENIEIPKITQEIKDILIESALFDWSKISPTIFGAVFESTLNPDTRRSGGMHYTSIENIHKVIDPLFFDGLKNEFTEANTELDKKKRIKRLNALQHKLAGLKFLDPACGSGNFLTETYVSLRRLENQIIKELTGGQMFLGDTKNPIQVSIHQFYGIEINDFAVTVAKTALWIAESQMMKETEDIVLMTLDFLPLKTNATIIEGNALQLDWNKLVKKNDISYVMGNPPFVGQSIRSEEQASDMALIWGKGSIETKLDYVICWYKKAIEYFSGIDRTVQVAFVSTNSICQGESVPTMWKYMVDQGAEIQFAYQTFVWESEAAKKAAVHCVIVGFSNKPMIKKKMLYSGEQLKFTDHINPYLQDAPDIWIENRINNPPAGMAKMTTGSPPTDDGALTLSVAEKDELLQKYPQLSEVIKPFIGAREFLHDFVGQYSRYCLWFKDVNMALYRNIPEIRDRLEKVINLRLTSNADRINKMADYPYLFCQIRQPVGNYLVFPRHSSEKRRYIPIGFVEPAVIAGDACSIIPDATLYQFAVLTSNVHNSWMRVVCGRLKSDFRYSPSVYNNFPWPTPTDEQKAKIEQTAQGILDARALYPDNSLADLYDPLTMPPELRKAHQLNDKAVMKAYGFDIKNTSEADCVAHLMKMYQEHTK